VATIRPATVDDADAISQLHVRSWQVAYRGLVPDDYLDAIDWRERAALRRDLLADAGSPVQTSVVVDGGLTGFIAWGPVRDEVPADADQEVYAVYVDPDRWRSGYGHMLLTHALDTVPDSAAVILWVLAGNHRARAFYERHGLSADGGTKTISLGAADLEEVRYRRPPSGQAAPSER
jgi:GNAT superfamily N-acetyltransferase